MLACSDRSKLKMLTLKIENIFTKFHIKIISFHEKNYVFNNIEKQFKTLAHKVAATAL